MKLKRPEVAMLENMWVGKWIELGRLCAGMAHRWAILLKSSWSCIVHGVASTLGMSVGPASNFTDMIHRPGNVANVGGDNDARGSNDGGPLRPPVEPDADGWYRRRPGRKVWIAPQFGKRFHRLGCGKLYAVNQAEEVDRIQALAKGHSQCRICKP